jgi:hypothetical protein
MNNRLFPQLLGKMGELIAYAWILNQGYKNVCLQGQDNNDHDLVYTDENNLMKTVQVKASATPSKYGFKFNLRFSEDRYKGRGGSGGKCEISNSDFFIFIF